MIKGIILLLTFMSALFAAQDTLSISIVIHDAVSVDELVLPREHALHPPYPNPFNPDVNMVVDLPEASFVKLEILNVKGQVVQTLEAKHLDAGSHHFYWKAGNFPSGIYFVALKSEQFEQTRKVILMK